MTVQASLRRRFIDRQASLRRRFIDRQASLVYCLVYYPGPVHPPTVLPGPCTPSYTPSPACQARGVHRPVCLGGCSGPTTA